LLTHMIATDRFGVGSDVSWIRSCSAISTPHDGTTLATILDSLLGAGGMERALVAMLPGRTTTDRSVYDFDLWHWGLEPRPGEGVKEFVRRVYRTLAKTKDLSSWDLTPQGARELNERVPVYPTVTYLTWANEETVRLPITGRHVSSVEMNPVFWAFGDLMGNYSGSAVSRPTDWWENDGVVNTVSMKGPSGARIVTHVPGEPLARGAFNFMGLSSGKDHLKMVGHYQDPFLWGRWLRRFYLDLARQLAGL
ncbi:MAG: lipase, partial [Candidatus Riflebacteria bacterium]|nr:lipase [Candidatus Riflebacteria bacterium]